MKKILSIFAFMAMLCIPFSLVSCGDDDDPVTSIPQDATFTIVTETDSDFDTVDKVIKLLQSKMGNEAKVGGAAGFYTIVTSNKAKGESLINGIAKYKDEIDKIVEANGKGGLYILTFKSGATVLYEYKYEKKVEVVSYAGTYTYTDDNGAVYTLTLTDEAASAGYKVGSAVLPNDVNGAKAGTYKGEYGVNYGIVLFKSTEKMATDTDNPVVRVTADFAGATNAGIVMTILVNSKTVVRTALFQKK